MGKEQGETREGLGLPPKANVVLAARRARLIEYMVHQKGILPPDTKQFLTHHAVRVETMLAQGMQPEAICEALLKAEAERRQAGGEPWQGATEPDYWTPEKFARRMQQQVLQTREVVVNAQYREPDFVLQSDNVDLGTVGMWCVEGGVVTMNKLITGYHPRTAIFHTQDYIDALYNTLNIHLEGEKE